MRKKNFFIAALLIVVIVANLFGVLIHTRPQYNCEASPGPHYCHLNSSKPRLIERTASSFPEDFQVMLGGTLLNFRQDLISKKENDKAVMLASQVYNEMYSDDNWSNLPSSLGISYEKFLKLNFEQSQYFLYVPQNKPERVIVFLHGFGGNFTSYLYVLSELAEDTNSIIVAPSYKNGVWDKESVDFIDKVISEVYMKTGQNDLPLSLIGFSNGGLVIPEYLLASKHQFSNIIGLSTYLDYSKYSNDLLINRLTGSNFTYIYGKADNRLGLEESLKGIDKLREGGISVRAVGIEGNHLIFFEDRDTVINSIQSAVFH